MILHKIFRPRALPMIFGVFLLLTLSIGVVSAQDGDSAQVRVVHAAPDAGNVDIYVDGELAIPELAYTDATDFQELPSGDHDIQVTSAGGTVEEAVIDTSVSLTGGAAVTLVAHGTGDSVELLEVPHDWDEPGADMARIVLVNATSDSANVELLQDGEPVVGDGVVPFGEVVTGEVEPGDYNYDVQVEGEVVTTLDGFAVEAGNTYSIFAMGDTGNYEVVPYQDMLAQAPGDAETPEADMTGTPETDETPEADMTGTPDAETTPDADMTGTPEADMTGTPEADMTGTPEADMTGTPESDMTGTPDADTTPDAAMTSTPEADMTPTMEMDDDAMTPSPGTGGGAPTVPETGAGGTAGEAGASGWIALAVAALAVALGGGLVWRSRNERMA